MNDKYLIPNCPVCHGAREIEEEYVRCHKCRMAWHLALFLQPDYPKVSDFVCPFCHENIKEGQRLIYLAGSAPFAHDTCYVSHKAAAYRFEDALRKEMDDTT